MDWVAEGIAIGSIRDAVNHHALLSEGVGSVLQLYGPEPRPPMFPPAQTALQLLVCDGCPIVPELLREGVGFIGEQRSLGRKVLVTCGAGMSRSPTFAAAYLHEQGMNLLEAFVSMMRCRPQILPHPELIRSLIDYYHIPITSRDFLLDLLRHAKTIRSL